MPGGRCRCPVRRKGATGQSWRSSGGSFRSGCAMLLGWRPRRQKRRCGANASIAKAKYHKPGPTVARRTVRCSRFLAVVRALQTERRDAVSRAWRYLKAIRDSPRRSYGRDDSPSSGVRQTTGNQSSLSRCPCFMSWPG